MAAVRSRKMPGRNLRAAQMMTPAITAKFKVKLIQYAVGTLTCNVREIQATDGECLNSSISSFSSPAASRLACTSSRPGVTRVSSALVFCGSGGGGASCARDKAIPALLRSSRARTIRNPRFKFDVIRVPLLPVPARGVRSPGRELRLRPAIPVRRLRDRFQ